jgi:hypothetical protein
MRGRRDSDPENAPPASSAPLRVLRVKLLPLLLLLSLPLLLLSAVNVELAVFATQCDLGSDF